MKRSSLRKLFLDLTPLIDMITILMFGVMIHAVEVSRGEVQSGSDARKRSDADRQALVEAGERAQYLADVKGQLEARLQEMADRLGKKEAELKALQERLDRERREVAAALTKLLDSLDPRAGKQDAERLKSSLTAQELSESGAKRILDALRSADQDPASAYKALRRIVEMEKVFTFVDLHLDVNDTLHVAFNGQKVGQFPLRDQTALQVENMLRLSDAFQSADWNQIVLFMFSSEGKARDRTVRQTEQGIKSLREHFQGKLPGRQFRYAPVGLVEHMPPTLERGR